MKQGGQQSNKNFFQGFPGIFCKISRAGDFPLNFHDHLGAAKSLLQLRKCSNLETETQKIPCAMLHFDGAYL